MVSEIERIWWLPEIVQKKLPHIRESTTLSALVMAGLRVGFALGAWIVQEALSDRGKRLTDRPACPTCGGVLESKGLVPRTVRTLLGVLTWRRRVWRCPHGCHLGQIAPYDAELGLMPYQQTSHELRHAACELAVFVPFRIAMLLMARQIEVVVSSGSIWNWVQDAGTTASRRVQDA